MLFKISVRKLSQSLHQIHEFEIFPVCNICYSAMYGIWCCANIFSCAFIRSSCSRISLLHFLGWTYLSTLWREKVQWSMILWEQQLLWMKSENLFLRSGSLMWGRLWICCDKRLVYVVQYPDMKIEKMWSLVTKKTCSCGRFFPVKIFVVNSQFSLSNWSIL